MRSVKIRQFALALVGIVISGLLASPVSAGAPSGCADLGAFPPKPGIDFRSQVQPIFSVCSSCHGEGGSAGLDLRPGEAFGNLVGVESTTNPPQARVEPFAPEDSVLLNAVNCSSPGGPSFQMPGTDPAQRAVIRDWIAQGALLRPAPHSVPVLHPVGFGMLTTLMLLLTMRRSNQRMRR